MRIHRLEIENFRCFEKQSFEFSPQFNVFIGENGKGKTAVLDALAVAVASFFLGIDGASPRAFSNSDIRVVGKTLGKSWVLEDRLPMRVSCVGSFEELGSDIASLWVGADEQGREVAKVPWQRQRKKRGGRTDRGGATMLMSIAKACLRRARSVDPVLLPLIAFHGTGRLWSELKQINDTDAAGPTRRVAGYRHALEPSSDIKAFRGWMKRVAWIAMQEGTSVELDVVRAAVVGCIPGCSDIAWSAKLDDLVATIHGSTLPFSMLSDGQQVMVGFVVDLARRCITLNPQLEDRACAETPGVVMIDEIDLHLHPKWQRRVVDDLRRIFPKVQFFATTHSPFIIQSLRAGELINLDGGEWTGEPMSVEDIASEVQGVDGVERSKSFNAMRDLANEYYDLLERVRTEREEARLVAVKKRLDELDERFATNPAAATFLARERAAAEAKQQARGGAR
jgi:predicted ATP-binding protein involved in virulence